MTPLQNFITSPYTPEHFKDFIQEAFPQAQLLSSSTTPYKDGSIIHAYTPICQDIELESSNILQVYAFETSSTRAKVTLHKELVAIAKKNAYHILACFYDPSDTQEFHLSLITTGFDFEANKSTHSNLRRQSFTLGSSIPTHTAQKQLQTLIDSQAKSKQALEEAFSLEPVTKEFYGEIVKIFITLIDSIQLPTPSLQWSEATTAIQPQSSLRGSGDSHNEAIHKDKADFSVDCHDSATAESRNDSKTTDTAELEAQIDSLV